VRIDHAVIAVSDPARSDPFYRDVLGAEILDLPRGRKAYRFGDHQLNVHIPGSTPEPVARVRVTPGNSDLCFFWDGPIESALTHLRVYFRDPDGSLLELISYDRREVKDR